MLPCDLIVENARILDVFRLRVFSGWFAVRGGRFLAVEEGNAPAGVDAAETRDAGGALVVPGLVDSHMHIESSLLTPRRFAEAAVPHGTTTVLADPHEVANVAGEAGVRWMIEASRGLPLDVKIALPSCVPATSPELEWTAAVFDEGVVERLSALPEVMALGEVMDYRRVLAEGAKTGGAAEESAAGRSVVLTSMMKAARGRGLLVEGHVPTLRGTELSEYLFHGVGSDHTLSSPEKLLEQYSKGVAVMLQAKSLVPEVTAAVNSLADRSRILLVTDDTEPSLLEKGHLSSIVEAAVAAGMGLPEAVASATIRPARYLGLDRGAEKRGAIAPGWRADYLVLGPEDSFPPAEVRVRGRFVAARGTPFSLPPASEVAVPAAASLPGPFAPEDFRLAPGGAKSGLARAVRVENLNNSLTRLEELRLPLADGFPVWPEGEDLAAAAVFARNGSSRSVALVKNLGLGRGAYASSFAHDSHNLLVVGRSPEEMTLAANTVVSRGGGVAVAETGRIAAFLPLPVLGLLSDEPFRDTARGLERVEDALEKLGMKRKRPFLILSLLALSVSPYAKLTDRGVVDTESRRILAPFETECT